MRKMELLDRIDTKRYDTEEIVDRANHFAELTDDERERNLGLWNYTGLDTASHPLSALLRESHNQTCVVRDIDGQVWMLAQESSISDRWSRGPLCRGNLIDERSLEDQLEHDPVWLASADIRLSVAEIHELLDGLPEAPGRLQAF